MRIVLDTNVVPSALLWRRGTPYRLVATVRSRSDARLFTSLPLIGELADVLSRPIAAKRLALIGMTAEQTLSDYAEAAEIVATPSAIPLVVPDDPDDDHVVAAAVAARADMIVSGDKHLLTLASYAGTLIVSPAKALERVQAGR